MLQRAIANRYFVVAAHLHKLPGKGFSPPPMSSNRSLAVLSFPGSWIHFNLSNQTYCHSLFHTKGWIVHWIAFGVPQKDQADMHAVAGYWKAAGEVSTSSSGIGSPQSNALSE